MFTMLAFTPQVGSDGVITFRCSSLCQSNSTLPPLIVPVMSEDSVIRRGVAYYRETRNESLLMLLHHQFNELPLLPEFYPKSLFIATWENFTDVSDSSDLVSNCCMQTVHR